MNEVDQLLLEQDLLSPNGQKQLAKHKQNNKENQPKKETPETEKPGGQKPQKNKLRDSTIEKLLNGEKDLKDIMTGEMSTEDKVTLKKKLSLGNSENEEIQKLLDGNIDEILGIEKKMSEDNDWVLSP